MNSVKVKLSDLIADPKNTRVHNKKNIEVIKNSLEKFGQYRPFVVQKEGMIVRVGNGMLAAMKELGWEEGFAEIKDLTEEEAITLSILDNKSAELASWDEKILATSLQDLNEECRKLAGFDDRELTKLLKDNGMDKKNEDGEAQIDRADELNKKWNVKTGDLYQIGNHRLLCGDSTKLEDVERVMNGEKADMVLTDPPYGVAYVGKTKDALTIENDDMDETELAEFIKKIFDGCELASRPGAYWFATVPAGPLHLIFAQDWKNRGILRQIMVWVKDSMVMGHSEYHYQHEPILFGWTKGDRMKNPDRTRTTVWSYARPKRSTEHPTMKPVDMWTEAVNQLTNKGDIVFEPCSGSGTTHIASNNINRKCYGIEIGPNYCAVILQRMSDTFPGIEIKKL